MNKNKTDWFYGLAGYQPQFNYSSISGPNQVLPVATSGQKAGTPTTQTGNLVAGGSGGGGSNFTGSYSSTDKVYLCEDLAPRLAKSEIPGTLNLKAYPNPFGNNVTIDFISQNSSPADFVITDVAGRVVEEFSHSSGTITTGSKLKPGIYYLSVTQDGFSQVVKIVKQTN